MRYELNVHHNTQLSDLKYLNTKFANFEPYQKKKSSTISKSEIFAGRFQIEETCKTLVSH